MASKRKDLIGNKFNRLLVVEQAERVKNGINYQRAFVCKCDCGKRKVIPAYKITSGRTKSCGCLNIEIAKNHTWTAIKHGHSKGGKISSTYISWSGMIQRCEYKKNKRYADWGGKGVSVCEKWHKFANFLLEMGERPKGKTLDRINPFGNYEKANCRWADRFQQAANKRTTYLSTI